jgi:hypothetical protein
VRAIPRMLAMAFGAALATVAVLPAMPAAASHQPEIWAGSAFTYEYENTCQSTAPYTCTVRTGSLTIYIRVYYRPTPASPISVSYRIADITTTAGQDYTGPTSGTVTIPANLNYAQVTIPVVDDGVPESYEQLETRITGSSLPRASFHHVRSTIYDGGRIPRDCVETASSNLQRSLTCNNRPAGQRWQISLDCFNPWGGGHDQVPGNVVTGNGRSDAYCADFHTAASWSYFRALS